MIKLIISLLLLISTNVYCSYYEHQFIPSSDIDESGSAHYSMYISDDIDTIRGVYCFLSGWQQNSRYMVKDSYYQEYATKHGFALMGFDMKGAYTSYYDGASLWSGQALIDALKTFAYMSKHSELEFAPMLFDGHSAGGQFSYHFALFKPNRVVAFSTSKGGYHTLNPPGEAIHVPGFMSVGERDASYRITNLTNIFEHNRPSHALWTLALEPNVGHTRTPRALIHAYFDAIIPLRMDTNVLYSAVPKLKPIDHTKGWLGNRENNSIAAYDDYAGDKSLASWLPNEQVAQAWRNRVGGISQNVRSQLDQTINIYPMPANHTINVDLGRSDYYCYKIFTLANTCVKQGALDSRAIDVSDLSSGVYTICLISKEKRICRKIIISE